MTTVYVTDYVSPEIYSNLRSRYTVYRGYGNDAKPWSAVAPIIDAALVRTQIITAGMTFSYTHLTLPTILLV